MYRGLHVKYLSILSDFNETSFLDRFSKSPPIANIKKFRPVGAGLFRADKETHTKLIVAYRNVTNVPKK
jgi:hypothetical protein